MVTKKVIKNFTIQFVKKFRNKINFISKQLNIKKM